ncbi:hypothetical protein QWZ14_20845, partial [Paeniroseomonas aquatica]|nr:hypothetical protein [Paeniroseomonas aquatica]
MSLSRFLPVLLILLAGLATPGLGQSQGQTPGQIQGQSQQAAPRAAPRPATSLTAADIDRLTSLLQDEARRAEFLRTLEALAEASQAQAGTAGEGSVPPPAAAAA